MALTFLPAMWLNTFLRNATIQAQRLSGISIAITTAVTEGACFTIYH